MKASPWKALASLRLTVACLAVSIVVIFIGTIAQVDEGLYEAQARYFKQWLVLEPVFFGRSIPIPLPGGYLLGTILVLNLIAAHIQRFTWSRRKWGIHLTHLGIVTLLVGQLATDMLSHETYLRLREGETRGFTEEHRTHELVFIRGAGTLEEAVVSFAEPLVAEEGPLADPRLPFELRVENYHVNSEIFSRAAVIEAAGRLTTALATVEAQLATDEGLVRQAESDQKNSSRMAVWQAALEAIGESGAANLSGAVERLGSEKRTELRGELRQRFQEEMLKAFEQQGGAMQAAAERMMEGEPVSVGVLPLAGDRGYALQALVIPLSETRELNAVNFPAATVALTRGDEQLGEWLFSPWLDSQEITIGETTWNAIFRPKRVYHPFEVTLLEATHEVYRGTEIPKNFQSRIRIDHPEKGEIREVDISMNSPLRYEGLTFYQYQMGAEELDSHVGTSTLMVVRNPTWLTPYLGCILIAAGMTYHFMLHLVGFIRRRRLS